MASEAGMPLSGSAATLMIHQAHSWNLPVSSGGTPRILAMTWMGYGKVSSRTSSALPRPTTWSR